MVGVEDAAGDRGLVAAAGEHELALLAHDDRGAGVLAHRQHAAGRDGRVLQQLERDEPVVGRRLGVVEDRAQLREVPGPQEVRDVAHRLGREQGQRLGLDLEEAGGPPASNVDTPSVVRRRYGVSSCCARREHVLVLTKSSLTGLKGTGVGSAHDDDLPHRARLDGRGSGPGRRAVGRADPAGDRELPDLGQAASSERSSARSRRSRASPRR